ncbi:thiol:disulfide interchange protein DsbA/DsbL [Pollutimonas thiosulfatoxidans]|uniref:Thiol:disulfide interchange protein n=1 Tax=Pollutimonas thiosulfatoxidans TaxID=2028345 RepID=A0A410GEW7_9BURK|nr:thiol:disulfide interchange protein DsbA/DsbL [Pollutimonas thiosulfatoxidans]MBF6616960.1 thiol:disulfide interchange protein DsbA/DsbL [Candidimonas sp.]NYT45750.1 thiol:disulfide interchange protein DsbA/DsbL [Alcaligenaceae bacterium]QAA94846.1 thiol:disulfide interchange protein [Pollutimonas thiosulfatoxidans]
MSLKNLLVRSLAIAAVSAGALFAPLGVAQAAENYVTVEPPQPSDTTGKIEVLEFFAYTCPHCNTIEPMVQKWAKTLPDNVVLKPVPVAFNASMADLQRLYYSLEALDRLDLHAEVFTAIHKERKRIYEADAIADWAASKGVDKQAFIDVFNSFGITSKVSRANELAKLYKIEGTPSIAVGGKYVTSPTMTNSYEATIEEAQRLVEEVSRS